MRVLVADDQEDTRLILTEVLRAAGHEVCGARDGSEALDLAHRWRPDMVISDILMPRMDGYALCRALKEDGELCSIPFVFYTCTFVTPEDERLAGDLGASRFLVKPMEPGDFIKVIEEVVAEHGEGRLAVPGLAEVRGTDIRKRYEDHLATKLHQKVQELTEKQQALEASEERLRGIVETVPDILFTMDPTTGALTYVSPAITSVLAYSPDELLARPQRWRELVHPEDRERVVAALEAGLREGGLTRLEGRLLHADGETAHWFEARIAVGLDACGNPRAAYGALRDIDQGKQGEQALQDSQRRLQNALLQTIEAVARTVEKRDPYTAGHQQQVARLAMAIAAEMGLAEETAYGIYLGGLIHDIGKIYVPAEILNRPGRLSQAEFNMVKTHAEVGYDIVKDIDLPWPVARMVLEHHERLDGSGYPQGLAGDAICQEAKVLAVADVVEAITSHRPYRPGLGVEVAMAEITEHAGTRYERQAVRACVRLLTEKGFRLGENL